MQFELKKQAKQPDRWGIIYAIYDTPLMVRVSNTTGSCDEVYVEVRDGYGDWEEKIIVDEAMAWTFVLSLTGVDLNEIRGA